MKLFGHKGSKPSFAEFDTRLKARRLQQDVLKANANPKRKSFEAMIGKAPGPQFAAELKTGQTFADFKRMDPSVKRLGLGRFFKLSRDYSKGGTK
jgi:hypothetical protein